MTTIPNDLTTYNNLLGDFRCTLKETSEDASNNVFMTSSQEDVVNFDKFKDSFFQNDKDPRPKSCDALYRYTDGTWFLIEFKNGRIENQQVIRKFFESLLLLTQKLGVTIDFTRLNLVYILVYNERSNSTPGYLKTVVSVAGYGCSKGLLAMPSLSKLKDTNAEYFDKLYVKGAYICSKTVFENEFVKKFAKTP